MLSYSRIYASGKFIDIEKLFKKMKLVFCV